MKLISTLLLFISLSSLSVYSTYLQETSLFFNPSQNAVSIKYY